MSFLIGIQRSDFPLTLHSVRNNGPFDSMHRWYDSNVQNILKCPLFCVKIYLNGMSYDMVHSVSNKAAQMPKLSLCATHLTQFHVYFENYHTAFFVGVYFRPPLIILNPTICDNPMFWRWYSFNAQIMWKICHFWVIFYDFWDL